MEDNKNPFEDNVEDIEKKEQVDNKTIDETRKDDEIQENSELQEKFDELNNKYVRLAADFDNFRKRTMQEKEELSNYTKINVLSKLTAVLDTFDRAKEHLKDIDESKIIKDGYEMAYKQLIDSLKKLGMEEMDALGKEFNPSEHEAVTQIPTDEFEADHVAVVMQKGYKLEDKVIRPALVGVAVKKQETKESD